MKEKLYKEWILASRRELFDFARTQKKSIREAEACVKESNKNNAALLRAVDLLLNRPAPYFTACNVAEEIEEFRKWNADFDSKIDAAFLEIENQLK